MSIRDALLVSTPIVLGLLLVFDLWRWRWQARRLNDLASRLDGLGRDLQTLRDQERRRRAPGHPLSGLRADRGRTETSSMPGPTLIQVPNLASPTPSDRAEQVARELAERFGPIWDLAQAGATAETIARATGHPVGQVELILGLRRQAGPSNDPDSSAASPSSNSPEAESIANE